MEIDKKQKDFEKRIKVFEKIFKPRRRVWGWHTTFYAYIQSNGVTCTKYAF
jgi:hypothetical protein